MRLHHVAIVCRSRKNADLFYQDLLGLTAVRDQTIGPALSQEIFGKACECRIVLYGNADFAIEVFIPAEPSVEGSRFSHVCLTMADRAAFEAACEDAGITVRRIPRGNGYLTFVKDPDGNLFEIKG